MALHWSIPMLKELLPDDLAARLEHDAVVDASLNYNEYPSNVLPIIDGVDGELISEMQTGGIRISRRKLRALCSEQMKIQSGHKLEGIIYQDGSVNATFSNGLTYTGTLLIGADGSRSCVRERAFPNADTTALDLVYINVICSYPDAEKALFARKANPVTALTVHPECSAFISMQDVKEPDRPETWVFQLIMMWEEVMNEDGTREGMYTEVKRRAEKLPEPFRSAFLWMPDNVELRRYGLGYWVPPTQS